MRLFLFFSMLFLSYSISFALASDIEKTAGAEEKPIGLEKNILDDHQVIAEMFDSVAESIDHLLAGSKISKEPNQTAVVVENITVFPEGTGYTNDTNLNVQLRLPNFEKYWQLKFTNYDDQTANRGVRGAYLKQKPREKNYGASVGFFREFESIRFTFSPRIGLEDPLNIAHSMAFETVYKKNSFEFNPRLELFANPIKGTGVFVSFGIGWDLSKYYTMSLINEGEYQEALNLFTGTNGFAIGQSLDEISSISYNFLFISTSRPNYHLDSINVSVAYNTLLYKKIIDAQIIPRVNFPTDQNFKGFFETALVLNVHF